MKYLLALILMVASTGAFACDLRGTTGLTEAQVKQIEAQCATLKANTAAEEGISIIEKVDEDMVEKWTGIANGIAAIIKSTAGELNIAVNEFVKTPVGMMVAGSIIFTVAGDEILSLVIGIPFSFIWMWICFRVARKVKVAEYKTFDRDFFGMKWQTTKPVLNTYSDMSEGEAFLFVLTHVIGMVGFIVPILVVIT